MYCPRCGTFNDDNHFRCLQCGVVLPGGADNAAPGPGSAPPHSAYVPGGVPDAHVPDYLVAAIIATICCCLPFGIAGIVYAAQAKTKLSVGDWEGAAMSADKAKHWTYLAFGVGFVVQVISLLIQMALGGLGEFL